MINYSTKETGSMIFLTARPDKFTVQSHSMTEILFMATSRVMDFINGIRNNLIVVLLRPIS